MLQYVLVDKKVGCIVPIIVVDLEDTKMETREWKELAQELK